MSSVTSPPTPSKPANTQPLTMEAMARRIQKLVGFPRVQGGRFEHDPILAFRCPHARRVLWASDQSL
jgi:hypothetical protein